MFTYLVSEIGESRDTRRVAIDSNDLVTMEEAFRYFRASPASYASTDPRLKILSWEAFDAQRNWLVDRLWTHDEKVALGVVEETFEVDAAEFRDLVQEAGEALTQLLKELE